MDGRSNPRAKLSRKLDVNVPDSLLRLIDAQVDAEARENPDISRSSWVRRELFRALRRVRAAV